MHQIDATINNGSGRGTARRAFTLIELLVVVSIIMLMLAILLPAMCQSREAGRRAACAANLHQIGVGQITYATDSFGDFIICNGRYSTVAFLPKGASRTGYGYNRSDDAKVDWIQQLYNVGLMKGPKIDTQINRAGIDNMQYQAGDALACPSRDYVPTWEPQYRQLVTGYRHLTGVEVWRNPWVGTVPSRSPVNLKTARPSWVMATDTTGKIDHEWGGGRAPAHQDMPSHKPCNELYAAGGNQVHTDGSVAWYNLAEMVYIHSFTGQFNRRYYFYQKDLGGWVPGEPAMGSDALD